MTQLPLSTGFIAQRSNRQNRQHKIFAPMPKFSYSAMNQPDVLSRDVRGKPRKKRPEDLCSVGRGKKVRGKEKYQAGPGADRQPVFDSSFPEVLSIRDAHRP